MRVISSIEYNGQPIDILRLDLERPVMQGNKYFKLQPNLEQARKENKTGLITFGGAFSNHLYAVAEAGKAYGFNTIGILRGEEDAHNPTLIAARELGMEIHAISRLAYQKKDGESLMKAIRGESDDWYVLPEGGTNALAVLGCKRILDTIADQYDHIITSVGTGGTMAGIIATPGRTGKVTGIAVLRGEDTLSDQIKNLLTAAGHEDKNDWLVNFQYHYGGYARYDDALMELLDRFYKSYDILPDPVYTCRAFAATMDMIDKGQIAPGTRLLVIHTGGMQGWKGWDYRFHKKLIESKLGPFPFE